MSIEKTAGMGVPAVFLDSHGKIDKPPLKRVE